MQQQQEPTPPPPPPRKQKRKKKKKKKHYGVTDVPPPPPRSDLSAAGLDTNIKLASSVVSSMFAGLVRGLQTPGQAAAAAARLSEGKSVYFLLCYFSFNI